MKASEQELKNQRLPRKARTANQKDYRASANCKCKDLQRETATERRSRSSTAEPMTKRPDFQWLVQSMHKFSKTKSIKEEKTTIQRKIPRLARTAGHHTSSLVQGLQEGRHGQIGRIYPLQCIHQRFQRVAWQLAICLHNLDSMSSGSSFLQCADIT